MTTLNWHSTSVQLLLSETKLLNDSSVSLDVYLLEVVEEVSSVTYHLEEAATAVVVLVVALEVLGEVRNSVSKNCDLNLGRSGVTLVGSVLFNNCLLFCCCHFRIHLSKIKYFCKYEPHRNREGEIHALGYLQREFYGRDVPKTIDFGNPREAVPPLCRIHYITTKKICKEVFEKKLKYFAYY